MMRNCFSSIYSLFKSHEDNRLTLAKKSIQNEIQSTRFGSETNSIFHFGIELLSQIPALKTEADKLKFAIILVGTAIVAMAREDAKYGPQPQYNNDYLYPKRYNELFILCKIKLNENIFDNPAWWEDYTTKMKLLIEEIGKKALIEKNLPIKGMIKNEIFSSLGPLVNEICDKYEKTMRKAITDNLNIPTVLNQLVGDYLFGQSLIVGDYNLELKQTSLKKV